jgi:hypothetical protein
LEKSAWKIEKETGGIKTEVKNMLCIIGAEPWGSAVRVRITIFGKEHKLCIFKLCRFLYHPVI